MSTPATLILVTALLAAGWAVDAGADRSTVCTITVNSADEAAMFRRSLPEDKFRFVELVERGRPDWLASACRQGIRCDVLIISGHFDGVTDFYSDAVDAREFLPVAEMERVSCSDSCPGLFSQLKEVYLFGCNTLNPDAVNGTAPEIAHMLARSGHSRVEAERMVRAMTARHGESSRDRMRGIFANVPVIYGFSSVAPLGPTAASILGRYFQSTSSREVGKGRTSAALLGHFAAHAMTAASGLRESDPQAGYRREVCQFFDERMSPAQKLGFIHKLLRGEISEVHLFFGRIEQFFASLSETERKAPALVRALDETARDEAARDRYLAFARNADQPALRARMVAVAGTLGWLSPIEQRAELMRMINDLLAGNSISVADVDLVCALNRDHALDSDVPPLQLSPPPVDTAAHSAALACLGSADGRARVLQALASPNDDDVRIAQVYLKYRPITDVVDLRVVTAAVARMTGSEAQVRALDVLGRHYVSDPESLEELARLFPLARSVNVQRAIAGILIRSDHAAIAKPEIVRLLREHRLKSPDGKDLIDALIRRLSVA
ncbi:MAG: hypothetical protein ABI886_08885 [Betaproteobacteria bacterium]